MGPPKPDLSRQDVSGPTSSAPILLVDDDAAKRVARKAILAPLGYPIVEADSGDTALRCVMAQNFGVILLDVRMPDIDGFETAALIRRRRQSEMTPIIFITEHASDEIDSSARYVSGAVDFMVAPVVPHELRSKVSVFMNLFVRAEALATQTSEVQESADQLRLLTDKAPIGIFQMNGEGRYVYTNPRWTEMTGIPSEEALGLRWEDLLNSNQRAGLITKLADELTAEGEVTRRYEMRLPDAGSRTVLETAASIPMEDGGITGWVGTVTDVTAEAGADAERARFMSLVQNSHDVIAVIDASGRCTYTSPAVVQVSGHAVEDVVGSSCFEFIHPDDVETIATHLREIVETPNEMKAVEVRTRTKSGEWIWIEIRAANRFEDPSIRGIILNYHDITERRTAADRIAASERSLADGQAISHFGSFVWDIRTGAQSWSDELFRLYGYDPNSIEPDDKTFLAVIHPDDRDGVDRQNSASAVTGEPFEAEFRIIRAQGEVGWIHRKGKVSLEDGIPVRMTGTCQDITASKDAEYERSSLLAKQQELTGQFRMLLDSTAEGIFGIDQDGVCTFINRSGAALLGSTPDSFIGKDIHGVVHHSYADGSPYPMVDCPIHTASATGLSSTITDEVMWRLDGSSFPVEYSSHPISGDGHAEGAVVTFQDVTVRRQMVEEIRRSEELFRGAFDAASTGIALIDADGRSYVDVNEALCAMVGYSKEEMLQLDWVVLTPPDDRERDLKKLEGLFECHEPMAYRKRYVRKDGVVITVDISDSLVRNADGSPMYFVTHVNDVTEQERASQEKENLQGQLRQAQKMEAVGQLAGGVAHDFNNILAVVLNYAEFVGETLGDGHEGHADLGQIIKAGERGAELVHQLLAFSRQEVIQPTVIDLSEVVDGMGTLLERSVGEEIELNLDLEPDLSMTKADHGQLEQILMNLVVNARDSMSKGGRIAIATRNEELARDERVGLVAGRYVSLCVSDTGSGIDPETLEHIFEPFFTTKARGEGTGLGLATVYGIVKQASGSIYAESELDRGTSFTVYLPVTEEEVTVPAERVLSPVSAKRSTILVVEDEDPVRELIGRILRREGFDVIDVSSGADAVEICTGREEDIDLLLTDVVMPRISGSDLRDLVHPMRPEMKVLFMSGYTDELIARRGVLSEGDSLLNKPFNSEQLLNRVRDVLHSQVIAGSQPLEGVM